jgi:hypothetical protein
MPALSTEGSIGASAAGFHTSHRLVENSAAVTPLVYVRLGSMQPSESANVQKRPRLTPGLSIVIRLDYFFFDFLFDFLAF